ncbi:hypothetical protein KKA66_01700 [Patescibacteria group bacterium]|nr:hypothetical protein [Patescibacteria group bacterium]
MKKQITIFLILIFILGLVPINGINAQTISERLKGRLLLQVEQGGAIWYVDTNDLHRYSVTWANALPLFQKLSLGITDNDLSQIPIIGNKQTGNLSMRNRLKGKLLLQVQQRGAIWFVDKDGYRHSVTWNNLMPLFESLALGITDADLDKIPMGEFSNTTSNTNNNVNNKIIEDSNNSNLISVDRSGIYREALKKLLNTYIDSYHNLNSDADSIILIMNERIGVLKLKSSELNNLSYGQDKIVSDMIKNLSSIYISDIEPLENKIETIKKFIEINNSKITSLNEILNIIKKENFSIDDETFKKTTDSIYSNDEWLQLADQALNTALNDYKLAMQSRDVEYKIGWNQVLTVANIVYYTPPTYTPPNYSFQYKPTHIKCYVNRSYNGNVTSVDCY